MARILPLLLAVGSLYAADAVFANGKYGVETASYTASVLSDFRRILNGQVDRLLAPFGRR
jgi:hypothetical protein